MTQLIDETLSQGLTAAGLPGAVALVADRDGVTYAKAFGKMGIDNDTPMTLDSLFWFASMTKAITSTAAMQLVEQGKLNLEAPLGALLPDLANPRVIEGFDAEGAPRLRPAQRQITLRHLLTHTAGIGYDFVSADLLKSRGPNGPPEQTKLDWLRVPLLFDPGDRWEYGMNTDWVGLAVEAASGQRLDAYLAEHVFGPLGMVDTAFVVPPAKRDRLTSTHMRMPDGSLTAVPSPVLAMAQAEFWSGGGGLVGTGGDYMRFLRMILNGGTLDGARILEGESVQAMSTNQVGDLHAGIVGSTMPHMALTFDRFPAQKPGWGLGFLINAADDAQGGRAAGSLAWSGLANTHYWIDPASNQTGLFLSQLLPFGDAKVMDLVIRFERATYGR